MNKHCLGNVIIFIIFFCGHSLYGGGCPDWTAGSGCWTTATNWDTCAAPVSGNDAGFGDCATGAACSTITVSMGGCSFCFDHLNVEKGCCNYTFQFENGTLEFRCHGSKINGNTVFTNGGKIDSRGAGGRDIFIAEGNNDQGTLSIDGACSTMFVQGVYMATGSNGVAELNLVNGSTSTINSSICMATGSNSSATITVSGSSTLHSCSGLKMTACCNGGGFATFIVSNSTVFFCGDLDAGSLCGAISSTAFVSISACSTVDIVKDFNIAHGGDTATVNISGACTDVDVCGGMSIGLNDGSGTVTISGACVTVANTTAGRDSCYGGNCGTSQLTINNGATLTQNCGASLCGPICIKNITVIIDGATHTGTADMVLKGCGVIRGDGCFGNGTFTNDLTLDGGTFNDGTLAGETLVLSGSIDQDAAGDDFIINGSGTVALGAADIIDNSIDVEINGGVLSTGIGAGFDETVQNVTLNSNSTIDLGTGSHELRMDDLLLGANTLTITGWTGTAGSAGTAGRLLIQKSSMTLNGGSSGTNLAGINFSGFGTNYDIVSFNGSLWEIVPNSAAVPEPSTWFAGVSILAFSIWHFSRRVACRRTDLVR